MVRFAMLTHRLTLLLVGVLAAGCGGGDTGGEARSSEQPPDVVIFLVDTLRADWTQLGGFQEETSPNLSALAEIGVVFEQASAPAPWTLPSVVSLFTGRHMAEHSVIHDRLKLPQTATTLAEVLQDWGYETHSYYRNPYSGEGWGLDQGFGTCVMAEGQTGRKELSGVLARMSSLPFFLYIHNTEPHDPHVVRKRFYRDFSPVAEDFLAEYGKLVAAYRNTTRADYVKKRSLGTTDNTASQLNLMAQLTERLKDVESVYSASVKDADDRLGGVVQALKDSGRWEHTLLIVVADHGEEMADHGGWQHDQSVYEELIHVPLVVRFPGNRHAGVRVTAPTRLIDIMPTVMEVVGCPTELPSMSGRSLMPLVRGEGDEGEEPLLVAMRHNMKKYFKPYKEQRGDINLAVRKGSMKGIFNVEPGTFELYDLAADPGEQRNLATEMPELAMELRRFAGNEYSRLLSRSEGALSGDLADQSAATLQALRDLGYLGDSGEDDE